jgi:DNA-binding transcriptional LysR family regulator
MTAVTMEWESRLGRRLRVRDLYILSTVVKAGGMAKAARQLAMSQPAVSEAIANLEHMLGVRLLDRSPRGIEPTVYAEAMLKRSTTVFDELRQSVIDVAFLADPATGELTIGCPETIAATALPRIMQRFAEKYPRVVLRVEDVPSPAIKSPGLRERKFDLIFSRLRMPLPKDFVVDDLNVEYLFDDPLVVAAGAHTKWARRRRINLGELVDEPWILAPSETWNYECVAQAFRARGLAMPKVNFVTFSVHLGAYFLSQERFISAYPVSWVRLNGLKALPVDIPIRPWPVAIATLKRRTLSPVAERFIECAREVAKSFAKSKSRSGEKG